MAIRPDEIVAILRRQIESFESEVQMEDQGSVLMVGDGIARVYGLEKALAGELLEFTGGVFGMVLNLEQDNIGAVILGPYEHIKEGDPVKRTGRVVQVPVETVFDSYGFCDLVGHCIDIRRCLSGGTAVQLPRTSPLRHASCA